jgi:P4 family phage/plasmid primase-like protien
MGDLTAFRAAVSTLFKPGEHAVSLFGISEDAGEGDILWLNDIQAPEHLPSYWTLSVPGWYDPEMGNMHVPNLGKDAGGGPRKHVQLVCLDGRQTQECDVFLEPSPFLVFEVDYLLIDGKEKPTPEIKKLQRDAMAYAFQAAGFPFAVLTDSGGKSIHATVRLDDDFQTIQAWRQSLEFRRLQDLAFVVFGHFDIGVMKQTGKSRLVRTPGATRGDGSPQTILATGKRVSIHDLTAWFASQLTPEAQQEVWGREPIDKPESPLRQRYLRIRKWRSDLMQTHSKGERGTHWMFVSKTLASAGCVEPRMQSRPTAQVPCGYWHASWLWHVSAFVFNAYSAGWFFSQDANDWSSTTERVRWWSASERQQSLNEQLKYEGATDPVKNALVDQMMTSQVAQSAIAELPPVPAFHIPPPHMGGITGATTTTGTTQPLQPKKKEKKNYAFAIAELERTIPRGNLIRLSEKHGGTWMFFDGTIWTDLPSDYVRALLCSKVLDKGAENKLVSEVYGTTEREYMLNTPWVENPHAIAFQNGTLYVHPDRVEFKPSHDPADRLRSLVPCHYDPNATCPAWENFVRWALPDPSRLSLLQEAFGYTLIPGQPYQSFFMFTGTGSNGKSVVLSVLQALHKDSFETVALANLGSRFSLGTIGRKRLAIDTEAENVTHQVLGEGNSATAILKAWTGGDPVKIEAKKVQGWSETINAKYIMACNRRPRFADPTKGVWRRLKLLKFESHIEERQADRNLPTKLLGELPGIVNWAILGLVRLVRQNGFTQSDVLSTDLAEYQTDSDSVAQFIVEFLRPAPTDSKEAWFDLRPFHTAYKEYCGQMAVPPVGESEFRQRLSMHNVFIGRPGEQDPVMQCPAGFERMPGSQYWAVKGWRCYHPAYTTQTLIGSYIKTATPQFAQQGGVR